MDRRKLEALQRLAALSAMKRDAELAKLAAVAQSRNRLKTALSALKTTEAPLTAEDEGGSVDPAMLAARLAHRRWIETRHSRLNQQLAATTADWLRQRPAASRAFGRAEVLETLRDRAQAACRDARGKER
ncbi:hypothetical protein [Pararhodobacter marinus]|uniref:hypothetical protein n=1 Tax=Pararhodobacter marinus TaxID=2184063 RepID=UPI0035193D8E